MADVNLTGMGIESPHLHDGDVVLDVIVLMHVSGPTDEDSRVVMATTPGMSWLVRRGMLEAARDCERVTETDDE